MGKYAFILGSAALLTACGTSGTNGTHAIGMCVSGPLCTTYTVSVPLNLPEQGAVSAFIQANCATKAGTFTGNTACDTNNTVAYCSYGDTKVDSVDVREVNAFPAGVALTAEQQACATQAGTWTTGKPGF